MDTMRFVRHALGNHVPFFSVDVDDAVEVCRKYALVNPPTLVCLVRGQEVGRLVGAHARPQVEMVLLSWLEAASSVPGTQLQAS